MELKWEKFAVYLSMFNQLELCLVRLFALAGSFVHMFYLVSTKTSGNTLQYLCLSPGVCRNKIPFAFLNYRCPLHIARSTGGLWRSRLGACDRSVPVWPWRTTRGEGRTYRVPTAAQPYGARYTTYYHDNQGWVFFVFDINDCFDTCL